MADFPNMALTRSFLPYNSCQLPENMTFDGNCRSEHLMEIRMGKAMGGKGGIFTPNRTTHWEGKEGATSPAASVGHSVHSGEMREGPLENTHLQSSFLNLGKTLLDELGHFDGNTFPLHQPAQVHAKYLGLLLPADSIPLIHQSELNVEKSLWLQLHGQLLGFTTCWSRE